MLVICTNVNYASKNLKIMFATCTSIKYAYEVIFATIVIL